MTSSSAARDTRRQVLGYVGAALLLLIVPVKLVRYGSATAQIVGVAPSLLGPSGLLFLLLSSPGRLSKLTVAQTGMLVGAISLGLEFAQLVPRLGILARVRYTFDVFDLLATVLSVSVSAAIAWVVLRGREAMKLRSTMDGMRPAALVATIFLALVALIHLVRLALRVEVTVGNAAVPMWMSLVAFVFTGALAYALWRENRR